MVDTVERGLYDAVDVGESDAALTESLVGNFIGGVDDAGGIPSAAERLGGEAEAREPPVVGLLERQRGYVGEPQAIVGRGEARCLTKRVADRQAHIGNAELSLDAAVDKFYHRMDYRLGVDNRRYSVGRDVEKPSCFDYLECLVEHRG